jgi:hypothetical protein
MRTEYRTLNYSVVICVSVATVRVFSNLLPGNDSVLLSVVMETGTGTLLSNGHLVLAPLFRLSAVTSQYIRFSVLVIHLSRVEVGRQKGKSRI